MTATLLPYNMTYAQSALVYFTDFDYSSLYSSDYINFYIFLLKLLKPYILRIFLSVTKNFLCKTDDFFITSSVYMHWMF